MSEIGVSFEGLCALAKMSQQNGTINSFIPVALQWAEKANIEIEKLQAEYQAYRELSEEVIQLRAENKRLSEGIVEMQRQLDSVQKKPGKRPVTTEGQRYS